MIDDMTALLKREQVHDNDKKAYCGILRPLGNPETLNKMIMCTFEKMTLADFRLF